MRALLAIGLSGCLFEPPLAAIDRTDATEPAIELDASEEPVQGMLSRVQSGTVSIANLPQVEIAIDPVVVERSVLWFALAIDTTQPNSGQVRGQLISPDRIRFSRNAASASGRVAWYLTEFGEEVRVQRGTLVLPNDGRTAVSTAIDPVDLDKSFILISLQKDGATYDNNDYMRATLTSSSAFEIASPADSLNGTIDWQVVTMERARVESGRAVLEVDDYGKTATVASLDPSRSVLLSTWDVVGDSSLIGPHVIRTGYEEGALSFARTVNGARIEVSWYIVELLDGSRVFSGLAPIGPSLTSTTVPIDAIDRDRSIALLTSNQKFGASSHAGNASDDTDNLGAAIFSAELISGSLVVQRGVAVGWGRPWWTVIEFSR